MMIRERLEAYKRQKRREEMIESIKGVFQSVAPWNSNKTAEEPLLQEEPKEPERLQEVHETESTSSEESVEEPKMTVLKKVSYLLYFLLWVTLYVLAIEFGFGAVYFIVTALLFICLNTRSKPRKKGEPSAYSVFNPNCEAIDGTLDASQFEAEIRYGIGSLR